MDRSDPILEVEAVNFSYGSVQVLFDISVRVERGEALALLGTNGAGKSTLLRVVSGLECPQRGRVTLDGSNVTGRPAYELAGKGIVLVAGGKGVFPDMTVAENLEMSAYLLRRRSALARERQARVLNLFPWLAERRGQVAGRLSGGEQQQLALARAMTLNPVVLCVDELSLGLAPRVVKQLLEAVRAIHATGTTIVLVEQSLNIAASICERAVFLEKGEVRFEGSTKDLMRRSDIARAVFLAERPERKEIKKKSDKKRKAGKKTSGPRDLAGEVRKNRR